MSEPTAPDSELDSQPDPELAVEPDVASDVAVEPAVEPSVEAETPEDTEGAGLGPDSEVATPAPAKNRQPLYIGIALFATLVITGVFVLLGLLLGDDKPDPVSSEDQAKAVAVALVEGTYKSALGDETGCRQMTDSLILTAEQGDFYDRCVEQTKLVDQTTMSLTIESVVATEVTLDEAAGTGTVNVDVTANNAGETETKNAPVPVKKVDGVWKVNPLG